MCSFVHTKILPLVGFHLQEQAEVRLGSSANFMVHSTGCGSVVRIVLRYRPVYTCNECSQRIANENFKNKKKIHEFQCCPSTQSKRSLVSANIHRIVSKISANGFFLSKITLIYRYQL